MIITTRITLEDFWKYVCREECALQVSPDRVKQFERQMQRLILPEFGGMEIGQISTEDIDRLLRKLKPKCANGILVSVKALLFKCFHIAVVKGIRPDNPVERVIRIHHVTGDAFRYSRESCLELLRAFQKSELGGVFTFQFLSGLSRAEAYAIRAGGIDVKSCSIMIDQFYVKDQNRREMISSHSKNYKARRITIPSSAMAVLLKEVKNREQKKFFAGENWSNEYDLVFTDHFGHPIGELQFLREIRLIRKHCDYKGARSLQDNFGVMAVELGASTVDLHEYLGHLSFQPVSRYLRSKGNIWESETINQFYEEAVGNG